MVRRRWPGGDGRRGALPLPGGPAGILTRCPVDACVAVAERLGPSDPQSVLVAAESFSSSVAGMPANGYFN